MRSDDRHPSTLGTRVSVIDAARLAVCRLDASAVLPDWLADRGGFVSVTRTTEELSIICPDEFVPPGVRCERGFRLLKVEGPLPFDAIGIIARLAGVLAAAQISLIAVGTFDTDYVLIKDDRRESAIAALRAAGFEVTLEGPEAHGSARMA